MYISVMRHGEATPLQPQDAARELTAFGRTQAQNTGRYLQHFCEQLGHQKIDYCICSPYTRTQQTYAELSTLMPVSAVEYNPLFTPSGDAQQAHDYIDGLLAAKTQNSVQHLLLVSHMPLVSFLADSLDPQFQTQIFATSSVLTLQYDSSKHSGKQIAFYQASA